LIENKQSIGFILMKLPTGSSALWHALEPNTSATAAPSPEIRPLRHRRLVVPLVTALLAAGMGPAWAMEPPEPGELAGYAADGTLAERVAYAKEIGNHKVDPELIARARINLERQVREAQGLDPGIAAAPPPAWRGVPTTGNVKMLCLLIEFNDYRHDSGCTQASVQSALFGAGVTAYAPYESLTNY
jgi:hypothetical protein